MRQSGLSVVDQAESFSIPAKATDDPHEIGPVDFAPFAVKLWDVSEAGDACRPLVGPDTAVVSLLNGIDL